MGMPSWPAEKLVQSQRDLETLRSLLAEQVDADPFGRATSYLANLLLIRSCGHLEVAEQYCVESFFGRLYGGIVAAYLDCTAFCQGRNPSPEKLKNFLSQVDHQGELSASLTDRLNEPFSCESKATFGNGSKNDCLKALVDARNAVVHGESMAFNVRVALDFADLALDVAQWYVDSFAPGGAAERAHWQGRSADMTPVNDDKRRKAMSALPDPLDASR